MVNYNNPMTEIQEVELLHALCVSEDKIGGGTPGEAQTPEA